MPTPGENEVTQITRLPDPTPEEQQLLGINIDLAQRQVAAVERQTQFQQRLYSAAAPAIQAARREAQAAGRVFTGAEQQEIMRTALAHEQRQMEIQGELSELELERARLGGAASPEQEALIAEKYGAALELGESDIRRQTQENLELLGEELAPALGLRPGDTPIQIRGQGVIEESVRQEAQLARALRAGEAAEKLSYPLEAGRVMGALSQTQQSMSSSAAQFQAALRAQASANRLQFASLASQGGLGLAMSGAAPTALGLAQQPRLAQGTTSQTSPLGPLQQMQAVTSLHSGVIGVGQQLGSAAGQGQSLMGGGMMG
jgi:hypothetical protein